MIGPVNAPCDRPIDLLSIASLQFEGEVTIGRSTARNPFSLQGRELESQGSIFDGDGLLTAQQETDESKDRQQKGWHMLRLFVPKSFQVNLLRADAIMANDSGPD
jgi:hypothetical protein